MPKVKLTRQEIFLGACIKGNTTIEAFNLAYGGQEQLKAGFYVYALIDPATKNAFYIGKGSYNRVHTHVKNAKNGNIGNAMKHKAIMEILSRGDEVVELIIDSLLSERAAFKFEKQITIATSGQLTNMVNAVYEHKDSISEHAKIMLSKIKPFQLWLQTMPKQVWVEVMKSSAAVAKAHYDDSVNFYQGIIAKLDREVYAR